MMADRDKKLPGIGLGTLLDDVLHTIPGQAAKLYTPDLAYGEPGGLWLSTGIPAEALRDYAMHFKDHDLWAQAAARQGPPPTGAVFDTDRLVDRPILLGSAFHNDYLARYDIGRCLTAVVDDGTGPELPRIRLAIVRSATGPSFSPAEIGRLERLTRLARSFVRLARAHETAARSALLRQAVIDLVRMPLILVDRDRDVLMANRAAMEASRTGGPVVIRAGRLRTAAPDHDRALDDVLARVADAPDDVRFLRLGTGRPVRHAPALVVTAITEGAAAEGVAAEGVASGRAVALVVRVLVPEAEWSDGETLLRQLLGLTPAESAVALGLAEGLSHDDIARRRGVKVTTVRTILQRLQEKLGIQKSGPLARFILGVAALGGLRL
jgi:DNA-binding CsgD family transcriptional regulator